MPRTNRIDVGNIVYHVINRANARMKIFETDEDYLLFEMIDAFKLESTIRGRKTEKRLLTPF